MNDKSSKTCSVTCNVNCHNAVGPSPNQMWSLSMETNDFDSLRSHERLPVLNCHLIVVRQAIQSPAPSVKRSNQNKLDQKKEYWTSIRTSIRTNMSISNKSGNCCATKKRILCPKRSRCHILWPSSLAAVSLWRHELAKRHGRLKWPRKLWLRSRHPGEDETKGCTHTKKNVREPTLKLKNKKQTRCMYYLCANLCMLSIYMIMCI